MPRRVFPRVVIVVGEGFESLDAFGPLEVFAAAARLRPEQGVRALLASVGGGARRTESGIAVETLDLLRLRPRASDTVLVAGAQLTPILVAANDAELRAWLQQAARVVRRIGSVCSGAFVLGAAGLLDGKRCATHWAACARLAADFPKAT